MKQPVPVSCAGVGVGLGERVAVAASAGAVAVGVAVEGGVSPGAWVGVPVPVGAGVFVRVAVDVAVGVLVGVARPRTLRRRGRERVSSLPADVVPSAPRFTQDQCHVTLALDRQSTSDSEIAPCHYCDAGFRDKRQKPMGARAPRMRR